MNHSESIGKLSIALSKAQSAMKPAGKDAKNPFFKSNYATLASVMDVCRGPLSINELAIVQGNAVIDGRLVVTTMLIHSSGEWIKDDLSIKILKDDPQGLGSTISYGRRYGLSTLVGVVTEDDDGEAGMVRSEPPAKPANAPGSGAKHQAIKDMRQAALNVGINDREMCFKFVSQFVGRPISDWLQVETSEAMKVIEGFQLQDIQGATNHE